MRLAAKLAAFRERLTVEERSLFDRTVTASLDADAIWPPDQRVTSDTVLPPVTVYTAPGCHACEELRVFLDRRGVLTLTKDVTADREAARELVLARRRVPGAVGAFPLVVIDDTVVVGFDALRLRDLLLPSAG
ncbi:MAG: glutaredoxin family protein [Candidatus Rokuibacteriota bacterium]